MCDWKQQWELIRTSNREQRQATQARALLACGAFDHAAVAAEKFPALSAAAAARCGEWLVLLSLLISPQTRNSATDAAMRALLAEPAADSASHLVWIEQLATDAARPRVAELLRAAHVAFWRQKSQTIQRVAATLCSAHNGCVPRSLEALKALPGVGDKIAHLTLQGLLIFDFLFLLKDKLEK